MLLYRRSSGHPHTLMKLLDHHKTYQSFLDAKEPGMNQMERRSLFRELCTYQDLLREWLVEGKRVSLTKKFMDTKERVPFEQIVSRCHLSCEGPMDKARVYALPDVKPVIAAMIYPLHDFIEYLTFSKQTMGLPEDALEWICLKRLQEASWEDDMLEEILGASTTLGDLDKVNFSVDVQILPAITMSMEPIDGVSDTLIEDEVIHLRDRPRLMQKISKLMNVVKSRCFKFRSHSSTPDVLLMTRSITEPFLRCSESKRQKGNPCGRVNTLTVGLTVINFSSEDGAPALEAEYDKFDKLFSGLSEETKSEFGSMTNVLVLCATGYNHVMKPAFTKSGTLAPPEEYKNVHEVILLDRIGMSAKNMLFGCLGKVERSKQTQ